MYIGLSFQLLKINSLSFSVPFSPCMLSLKWPLNYVRKMIINKNDEQLNYNFENFYCRPKPWVTVGIRNSAVTITKVSQKPLHELLIRDTGAT